MPQHPHFVLRSSGEEIGYTSPQRGRRRFKTPVRDSREAHARKLMNDVSQAERAARIAADETGHLIKGLCLEIVGEEGYDLKVESLEDSRLGTEVRAVQRRDDRLHATVYVPEGKLERFVRKIEQYECETTKSGRPRNEDLVAGISGIRSAVLRAFWTDDEALYPSSEDEAIWWEVWVRVASDKPADNVRVVFVGAVDAAKFRFSEHDIRFPERLVFLAYGSPRQWTEVFVPVLDQLAELRRAKEVPTGFLNMRPAEQGEYVDGLSKRIRPPGIDAPAVCVLDYGVHAGHPLLLPFISERDVQALSEAWEGVDGVERHGTEMAGLAVFGDGLAEHLLDNAPFSVKHRLESVRIFRTGHRHPPDTWGAVTQEGLALAEERAPKRGRVACLAATADDNGRDTGRPSSWSAAIDEHASGYLDGERRLYVVAAGNIRDFEAAGGYLYPEANFAAGRIEDPGQSWNALTVGAFTNHVHVRSDEYRGHQPVAPRGGLSPGSRTSCQWDDDAWPLKPDIVMEGGNYVRAPGGQIDGCEDLSLLTTTLDSTGRLLTWMSDTSAATAQAARYAAILMADYPQLWPETIRGLLVHSASWTDEMCRQVPGNTQADLQRRLRCFGYGVPDLGRARYTVENHVSLVHQGRFQPYKLDGSEAKTNHFVLHSLPWPKEALRELDTQDVVVRITLSYFIEPSPAGRGWGKKFRYASHGLRFALRGPTESEAAFRKRISREEWNDDDGRPATGDPIEWEIGSRLRTRGSIHCDWWKAPGADVADCGQVAVFPVTGWWRERKHLGFVGKSARYALIITISTPATEVDLLTPIAQQIALTSEIVI